MLEVVVKFVSGTAGAWIAGGLFTTIMVGKSFVKKWKEKLGILKQIEQAKAVKESLIEQHTKGNNAQIAVQKSVCRILGFTEADRVGLFQYSNGDKTFNGGCLRYVTCTAEDSAIGVSAVILEFQKKGITPDIALILDRIDKADLYSIVNAKDLVGTEKVLSDSYGLVKSYHFKLGKSVWEGVLSISYLHEEYELSEEQISRIKACIKLINDFINI